MAVIKQIHTAVFVLGQVTAFYQHVPWTQAMKELCRLVLARPIVYVDPDQQPLLVEVRRKYRRPRQKPGSQRVERGVREQLVAVHRGGYWVDYQRGSSVGADVGRV